MCDSYSRYGGVNLSKFEQFAISENDFRHGVTSEMLIRSSRRCVITNCYYRFILPRTEPGLVWRLRLGGGGGG